MTPAKRIFDVVAAVVLLVLLLPVLAIVAVVLLLSEGRPIFYVAERMHSPTRAFGLIKFRTMRPDPEGTRATGVTGGDKSDRMSRLHLILRATRLDEIPQLWNVLRGEMSLVGPRPPLRVYTDAFPDLYAQVLQARPGITGLASLLFHRHEERMLAPCETPEQTDAVYRRVCIPRKAKLDLIYARHQSVCWDISLLWQTVARVFAARRGRKG